MVRLRGDLVTYARSSATVLVLGETGTGKELVARSVHALSPRGDRGPFVAINVAAIAPSLLGSELFGHERGAFTGATTRHRGAFEQAHGGTLFLDEIGELTPDAQAALLRVLETRCVRALGAERERKVDVRLVVATHRDLARGVRQGLFRSDLYFRLNALVLGVPPLRHRSRDLVDLAPQILRRMKGEVGERQLDASALQQLISYPWPGNVRQLQNVLLRAAVRARRDTLVAADITGALADEIDGRRELRDATHAWTVQEILRIEGGNVSRTARYFGVARSTVRDWRDRYGVSSSGS